MNSAVHIFLLCSHRYPSPSTRVQYKVSNAHGLPASMSSLPGKNLTKSEHNSAFEQKQKPSTGFYLSTIGGCSELLWSATLGGASFASLTFLVLARNGVMTIVGDVPCSFPGLSLLCPSSVFP